MKNDYDFIAPFYDLLVKLVFGNHLFRAQMEHMNHLPETGRILFIGGGSGKALQRLIEERPQLQIDYIDASTRMIDRSKKKLIGLKHHVRFIHGTEQQIPAVGYDAILSFFFLDLFPLNRSKTVFQRLSKHLKPKGYWLVADFNIPRNFVQRILEKGMFVFLKVTTGITSNRIDDYPRMFESQVYTLKTTKSFYSSFVFSNVYQKALE